ncbi:hypothetical protein [Enterovibrio nigricans]|nr:hypothetical protein [Enterovibrio nigricans]
MFDIIYPSNLNSVSSGCLGIYLSLTKRYLLKVIGSSKMFAQFEV